MRWMEEISHHQGNHDTHDTVVPGLGVYKLCKTDDDLCKQGHGDTVAS